MSLDKLMIKEYYISAIYAMAVGTPREAIQYGELQFSEEDKFEAAEGFRLALEATEGKVFNCSVMMPDGYRPYMKEDFDDPDGKEDYYDDEEDE